LKSVKRTGAAFLENVKQQFENIVTHE
jgi:hypothetical protein